MADVTAVDVYWYWVGTWSKKLYRLSQKILKTSSPMDKDTSTTRLIKNYIFKKNSLGLSVNKVCRFS